MLHILLENELQTKCVSSMMLKTLLLTHGQPNQVVVCLPKGKLNCATDSSGRLTHMGLFALIYPTLNSNPTQNVDAWSISSLGKNLLLI